MDWPAQQGATTKDTKITKPGVKTIPDARREARHDSSSCPWWTWWLYQISKRLTDRNNFPLIPAEAGTQA